MVRAGSEPPAEIWRCIEPFAIFDGPVPRVFSPGLEVMGDDPILRSHRANFEPASARVVRAPLPPRVEQATAAPGERRSSVIPVPVKEPSSGQE